VNIQKIDWERFVNSHDLPEEIPPLIANSWERCWPLISATSATNLQKITDANLLNAQVMNFDFLSIARPIMEDISRFTETSETAILIVNPAAYVLDILGDPKIIAHLSRLGIQLGALLSEMEMGTNGFALAITEKIPVQVQGYEHYRSQFHSLVEAAAPIFDVTGKLLGVFGIINFKNEANLHSLALAVSGARAIEAQRRVDHLLGEQSSHLARLNAILNTISEAILVWNRDGILNQANPAAVELFSLTFDPLQARSNGEIIKIPRFIANAVELGKELTDVEATIEIGGRSVDCVLSIRFVKDPEGIQAVVTILRQANEIRQLVQRQIGSPTIFTLQDLLGESLEMQRVQRQARLAAAARASVVIRGEVGTGKNLLAQIIHTHSSFSAGPFIVFSCTSVPSEMVVRELVGFDNHTSRFNGDSRPGKIELADGGTLFLQDVDTLPLDAQTILLNFLELGIIQRLNNNRSIPLDVRLIASSKANMEKLIEQGNFLPDLYYHLSSFEIRLPPLRERLEDLPLLVNNILKRLSVQYNVNLTISPEAMVLLNNYHWPGNLRELEAVLGRAASQLIGAEPIAPEHFPDFIRRPYSLKFTAAQLVSGNSLSEIEHEALLQSARACGGNLQKMTKVLGISRTTLWRKLRQYNIQVRAYRNEYPG
jgi:transcriptional activator for dhaKLM operon